MLFLPAAAAEGGNQAVRPAADQVGAPGAPKRFDHERAVLRPVVLHQRPLHFLVMRRFRHIHRRHVAWVELGIEHRRGQRARGRIEILHLLGVQVGALHVFRQLHRVLQRAAGVAAHEIRHEVLILAISLICRVKAPAELIEHRNVGLAHILQRVFRRMLRRDLQLAADVILHQLAHQKVLLIQKHIVEPDAGAHEHLLHARQRPQRLQDVHILRMVGVHIFTGCGKQALSLRTRARFQLLVAGRVTEVRRRAAHVMNIALEARPGNQLFRLRDDGSLAPGGDDAPLMERERAEIARAEASALGGDGEFHLLKARNAARLVVHRMPRPRVRQRVHLVQLLRDQRHGGLVLQKVARAVLLCNPLSAHGVLLVVLHEERPRVSLFIAHDLLGGFDDDRVLRRVLRHDAGAGDVAFREMPSFLHPLRHAQNRLFAHAEHQNVRAAVHQNGIAHAVVPVIVVRETPKRRFHAADADGNAAVGLADAVAIHHGAAVGPHARLAAGRIHVGIAVLLRGGIVVDHRIDHARRHQKAELRLAEAHERALVVPVRLRQHAHAVARVLKHAGNNRQPERRVIDIRVARHIHKIRPVPAPHAHFLCGYRQKPPVVPRFHGCFLPQASSFALSSGATASTTRCMTSTAPLSSCSCFLPGSA